MKNIPIWITNCDTPYWLVFHVLGGPDEILGVEMTYHLPLTATEFLSWGRDNIPRRVVSAHPTKELAALALGEERKRLGFDDGTYATSL